MLVGLVSLVSLSGDRFGLVAVQAQSSLRTGMTWTVLEQSGGYVHVGGDAQSNPYTGDTTVDQYRPLLCLLVDGRPAPDVPLDYYDGWTGGAVQATPPIPGTLLTSQADADAICADTFGDGWRMAEFHDGGGGWSYWAADASGTAGLASSPALTPGTRVWVAINDQPANPWNSAGDMPASVPLPKFFPSDQPVPNQYLALFSEDTAEGDVETLANSLAAQYGGTIIDVLSAVQGFSFTASGAQARAMANDPRVESVDEDTYAQPTSEWQLDRVDQRVLPLDLQPYTPPNNGSGVAIYILDTGFRRSHTEFGSRAVQAADFIRFFGERDDCDGHGTAVGSMAGGATVGVAPGALLVSVRIAGCHGNPYNPWVSAFSSTIVAGLNFVAQYHVSPAVANVSYRVYPGFWRRWFHLRSPVDRAAAHAVSAGVTVVAAAGNDSRNADHASPARDSSVISVSGTDGGDRRFHDFNWGKVDMFAPGFGVKTAGLNSDTDYRYDQVGTSFAAPMVAGAAALYLHDHPGASPGEVRNALITNATPNVVVDPGPGSANRMLYVNVEPPATHAGMSWSLQQTWFNLYMYFRPGADSFTNPYSGDTPPSASLPVLCLLVDNRPTPSGLTPDFYTGWSKGIVALSPPVSGSQLTSRARADGICASAFGAGWRMGEFHDGWYGPNLSQSGGWSFWGIGGAFPFNPGRFWVAINDQAANPWN